MSFSFEIYAINGNQRTLIDADAIEIVDEQGNEIGLAPRKSDGEISIYGNSLVIKPIATNVIRVSSGEITIPCLTP